MPQSGFILGAIFISFIVWIITRGDLSTYIGFFTVSNNTATQSETGTTTTQIGSTPIGGSSNSSGGYNYTGSNPLLMPDQANPYLNGLSK